MSENNKRRWRGKYEWSKQFGHINHVWSVVAARGGAHLHISEWPDASIETSGGIEVHFRFAPESMRDDPPSHDRCWLLQCPCWHDGSSLQVTETWIPLWRSAPNDHEMILDRLAAWLFTQIENEESADD